MTLCRARELIWLGQPLPNLRPASTSSASAASRSIRKCISAARRMNPRAARSTARLPHQSRWQGRPPEQSLPETCPSLPPTPSTSSPRPLSFQGGGGQDKHDDGGREGQTLQELRKLNIKNTFDTRLFWGENETRSLAAVSKGGRSQRAIATERGFLPRQVGAEITSDVPWNLPMSGDITGTCKRGWIWIKDEIGVRLRWKEPPLFWLLSSVCGSGAERGRAAAQDASATGDSLNFHRNQSWEGRRAHPLAHTH